MGSSASKSETTTCAPRASDTTHNAIPRSPASPHLPFDVYSPVPLCEKPTRPSDGNMSYLRCNHAEDTPAEMAISHPLRRAHLRKLSELIDPVSLAANDDYVKSPSGNLLCRYDFVAREDRPLSLRERQERIRQQMCSDQTYAVSGIASKDSSPRSAEFPLFGIAEELSPTGSQPSERKKSSKSLCCF